MAQVLLNAGVVMRAVALALQELRQQSSQVGGDLSDNQQMLSGILQAAQWIHSNSTLASDRIVLSVQEAQLIEPYLTP